MASTLLNAVAVATTSAGVAITGNFEASVSGDLAGGTVELQRAIADVDADYVAVGKEGVFFGKGHVAITNTGTNYFRGVFRPNPVRGTGTPSVTLKTNP